MPLNEVRDVLPQTKHGKDNGVRVSVLSQLGAWATVQFDGDTVAVRMDPTAKLPHPCDSASGNAKLMYLTACSVEVFLSELRSNTIITHNMKTRNEENRSETPNAKLCNSPGENS